MPPLAPREILGWYMKTHVAVYEEGLFDLGGATFLRGANAPSHPPPPPPPSGLYSICMYEKLIAAVLGAGWLHLMEGEMKLV